MLFPYFPVKDNIASFFMMEAKVRRRREGGWGKEGGRGEGGEKERAERGKKKITPTNIITLSL